MTHDPEYTQVHKGEVVTPGDPHAYPEHDNFAPGWGYTVVFGATFVLGALAVYYLITAAWSWWLGL